MKEDVGVWIDHRKAVVVHVSGEEVNIESIVSGTEKHVRFSGQGAEDHREHRFSNHLKEYYEKVIRLLQDAGSILIMGPGEAKVELSVRLKGDNLGDHIEGIEAEDKMTDGQIVAKVREHFHTAKK
jgi:hypothetical protein